MFSPHWFARLLHRFIPDSNFPRHLPLLVVLVVPCTVQLVITLGISGLLLSQHQHQEVEEVAGQWRRQVTEQVEEQLQTQLMVPTLVNRLNADAMQRAEWSPTDLRALQSHFWQQLQQFPTLTMVGFSNSRVMVAAERLVNHRIAISRLDYATNQLQRYGVQEQSGSKLLLSKLSTFMLPHASRWQQMKLVDRQSTWVLASELGAVLPVERLAVQPVLGASEQSLGRVLSGINFSDLHWALRQAQFDPTCEIFIVERSGSLVAAAQKQTPSAHGAQEPMLQQIMAQVLQRYGGFQQISSQQQFDFLWDGDRQYVQVTPYSKHSGLDWFIVVVMPTSVFAKQIPHNLSITLLLCLISLGATLMAAAYLNRKLAHPILQLSEMSQKIAQGGTYQPVDVGKIKELAILSAAFNRMSQEIQQSQQVLEEYSQSLEQKVSERTQALQAEIQKRITIENVLHQANHELERLAFIDGLTQVANRRYFDEQLKQEWWRLKRTKSPLSLILCDLDFFKQYNDTYGHQAGDDCLRKVANALQTAVKRPGDLVARYGGEEFAIILPDTSSAGAMQVAQTIQQCIQQLKLPHQGSLVAPYVTLSLGVVTVVPHPGIAPTQLIAHVDRALYRAKSEGRNRIATTRFQLKKRSLQLA